MLVKLYGVISEIGKENEFFLCEPVYVMALEEKVSKYYRINESGDLEEIDIGKYGSPVFLPAARKKVGDGNKYFIVFKKSQNYTRRESCTFFSAPMVRVLTEEDAELDLRTLNLRTLSVGIKFPDKFVCVYKENQLTAEELERHLWEDFKK